MSSAASNLPLFFSHWSPRRHLCLVVVVLYLCTSTIVQACECWNGGKVSTESPCTCSCTGEFLSELNCRYRATDYILVEVFFDIPLNEFISETATATLQAGIGLNQTTAVYATFTGMKNASSAVTGTNVPQTLAQYELRGRVVKRFFDDIASRAAWTITLKVVKAEFWVKGIAPLNREPEYVILYDNGAGISVSLQTVIYILAFLLGALLLCSIECCCHSNTTDKCQKLYEEDDAINSAIELDKRKKQNELQSQQVLLMVEQPHEDPASPKPAWSPIATEPNNGEQSNNNSEHVNNEEKYRTRAWAEEDHHQHQKQQLPPPQDKTQPHAAADDFSVGVHDDIEDAVVVEHRNDQADGEQQHKEEREEVQTQPHAAAPNSPPSTTTNGLESAVPPGEVQEEG